MFVNCYIGNNERYDALLAQKPATALTEPGFRAEASSVLTPCIKAILVVIMDACSFCSSLAHLSASNQEQIKRAIQRELGNDTLRGFSRAIEKIKNANDPKEMAQALWSIISGFYNAGGFRIVLKMLKDTLTWWEWVKTGVIAIAQIVAWFATDGVAFIGEVALTIMAATQLIEDCFNATKICRKDEEDPVQSQTV